MSENSWILLNFKCQGTEFSIFGDPSLTGQELVVRGPWVAFSSGGPLPWNTNRGDKTNLRCSHPLKYVFLRKKNLNNNVLLILNTLKTTQTAFPCHFFMKYVKASPSPVVYAQLATQRHTLGHWSFSMAGPMVWNSLTVALRDPACEIDTFKQLYWKLTSKLKVLSQPVTFISYLHMCFVSCLANKLSPSHHFPDY